MGTVLYKKSNANSGIKYGNKTHVRKQIHLLDDSYVSTYILKSDCVE